MSQQINLFNPALAYKKPQFSATSMAQALGLVLVGLAALYGYTYYRTGQAEKQAAEIARTAAADQARLTKFSQALAPHGKSTLLEGEVMRLQNELAARQQALKALQGSGEFGDTKGYSAYLIAFARQIVSGLWLTEFSIRGQEMALAGRTLDPALVPQYIQKLKREPVMQGRSFERLEMTLPKEAAARYIEFSLGVMEQKGASGTEAPSAAVSLTRSIQTQAEAQARAQESKEAAEGRAAREALSKFVSGQTTPGKEKDEGRPAAVR